VNNEFGCAEYIANSPCLSSAELAITLGLLSAVFLCPMIFNTRRKWSLLVL